MRLRTKVIALGFLLVPVVECSTLFAIGLSASSLKSNTGGPRTVSKIFWQDGCTHTADLIVVPMRPINMIEDTTIKKQLHHNAVAPWAKERMHSAP